MGVATLESAWGEAAEEERLRALADLGITGTGREERFDRITRLARQLFGVERVAITLLDRDVQWFKSEQGFDGIEQVPRAPSFCNATIAQPGLTVAEDTRRDHRAALRPLLRRPPARLGDRARRRHALPLQRPAAHVLGGGPADAHRARRLGRDGAQPLAGDGGPPAWPGTPPRPPAWPPRRGRTSRGRRARSPGAAAGASARAR